jgi:hypothetical protein
MSCAQGLLLGPCLSVRTYRVWLWARMQGHRSVTRHSWRGVGLEQRDFNLTSHAFSSKAARRALEGLHVAARSLQASVYDLGGTTPSGFVDARRLCAVSLSAGRLVGYLEALEATDQRLAPSLARDVEQVIATFEDVRRRFEHAAG